MPRMMQDQGWARECKSCCGGVDKSTVRLHEALQWRREWQDEACNEDQYYLRWECDGPNEFESKDLLHRLADDETIAYWMNIKTIS